MNRRSFFGLIFALPLLKNFKPQPKVPSFLDIIRKQQEERLLALGPVIERLNQQNQFLQEAKWVSGVPRRFIGIRYITKANS